MSDKNSEDRPQTILIVVDIPASLGVALNMLQEQGFCVLIAQDAAEGIERARFARPDLILLDVTLPDMNGFDVCRQLKADAATRDIPVIFMTALADAENRRAGFAAGGVDYVIKPLETAEVLARVETHLALRTMQRELETQNRQLQQAQGQLLQSEKMASVGLLAAGVAHEINNPVGFVSSNLETLEGYVANLMGLIEAYEQSETSWAGHAPRAFADITEAKQLAELDYLRGDLSALISESRDGLERVKKIVASLKEFSHVGPAHWQVVDLHKGLDSTLNLVWHELKYKAHVHKEYGCIDLVECMPTEVNQIFMNLLVNAAQAIPNQGEIHIRTGQAGDEVWVEIADSGKGIPPEHLQHIFDPFFTTKPVGIGTGLGLSLSYATAQKHGGRIEVRSSVGQGTTFRVCLPCRRAAA